MLDPAVGDASRNRTVGLRIGKGEKLEDIIKSTNTVAEGVLTSRYTLCIACTEYSHSKPSANASIYVRAQQAT